MPSPLPGRVTVHVVLPQGNQATPLAFHYLEHLVWLQAMGPDGVGADRHSNAFTSAVAVDYWLSGESKDLTGILRRLARIFEPLAPPRDVAIGERDILLREYEARVMEKPVARADLAMSAFLYAGNRLALSPLGTPERIRALNPDRAAALHEATHRPERATLLVIGDVSRAAVSRAMKEAGWPVFARGVASFSPPPFRMAAAETKVFRIADRQAAPHLLWRRVVRLSGPVDYDLLEARGALLGAILSADLPGGLAGPLRYDAALAQSFVIAMRPIDDRHVELVFDASPERGVPPERLRAAFEKALARIARSGIPEATFRRVLKRFSFWLDWEDEQEVRRWLAGRALRRVLALRRPPTREAAMRLRERLSRRALNGLLRRLVRGGRTAVAFIGPSIEPEPGEDSR